MSQNIFFLTGFISITSVEHCREVFLVKFAVENSPQSYIVVKLFFFRVDFFFKIIPQWKNPEKNLSNMNDIKSKKQRLLQLINNVLDIWLGELFGWPF